MKFLIEESKCFNLIFFHYCIVGKSHYSFLKLILLGLLYNIYEKTYGDAHAKLGKSSNFQIYPGKTGNKPPHYHTAAKAMVMHMQN